MSARWAVAHFNEIGESRRSGRIMVTKNSNAGSSGSSYLLSPGTISYYPKLYFLIELVIFSGAKTLVRIRQNPYILFEFCDGSEEF